MSVRHTHLFENCMPGVEDLHHPDTKDVVGKIFIILDPDSGEIWRCPMSDKIAKRVGQALMGIGKISVVDELEMRRELKK